MSEKVFKIMGEINKPLSFEPMTFSKDVKALKMEHAVERVYSEMGSRHKAKRYQIKILSVEEVKS